MPALLVVVAGIGAVVEGAAEGGMVSGFFTDSGADSHISLMRLPKLLKPFDITQSGSILAVCD